MFFVRIVLYTVLLFAAPLLALEIDESTSFSELLPHTEVYIDRHNDATVDTIAQRDFTPNHEKSLSYGYSPDFTVWIRFVLANTSEHPIERIIEYANPLTSDIALYNGSDKSLIKQEGLFHIDPGRDTLHPVFYITLDTNTTRTFYIKAPSRITPLIITLKLWDIKRFYQKELQHQLILALFFGAMGIIILYNLIVYFAVREKAYLYYVLAFIGITFHHLIYKGVAGTYLLPNDQIEMMMKYSTFIVAFPTFFLALFTKEVLNLKQYPKLNKTVNYYLTGFPFFILLSFIWDLNTLRSLISLLLLLLLFFSTFYALIHHNRQAKFITAGWVIFFTSALFVYLSSLGIYDIFEVFPHYVEASLILEALLFSLLLSDKIKRLHQAKIASQQKYIAYKNKEEQRLTSLVNEKTAELKQSLDQKETLLQELNHRVKNSMQTIVSFIRLQIDTLDNTTNINLLQDVERRVLAINHLYALLHTRTNISSVYAYEFFSLIADDIERIFQKENIKIRIETTLKLPSKVAVYCGLIVNEAITNSFKYAFDDTQEGLIEISFIKEDARYHLTIKDNGQGYDKDRTVDGFGLFIMQKLAVEQLNGQWVRASDRGSLIEITWREQ